MRHFNDEQGRPWVASVGRMESGDYKGQFFLVMARREGRFEGDAEPADEGARATEAEREALPLNDVRWNSAKTADRTLATMSDVELRRRLRAALGRSQGVPTPLP